MLIWLGLSRLEWQPLQDRAHHVRTPVLLTDTRRQVAAHEAKLLSVELEGEHYAALIADETERTCRFVVCLNVLKVLRMSDFDENNKEQLPDIDTLDFEPLLT